MSGHYALRVLPSWPWAGRRPGDIVRMALVTTREEVERVRQASANAEHYEVVELDGSGQAVEP